MFVSLDNKARTVDEFYAKNFVEFKDPLNPAGKAIYVARDKAKIFNDLVGNMGKNFNDLYLYKQIASLKGVGWINSLVSKHTALSRALDIEGGRILYSVWSGRIYITQIQMQHSFNIAKNEKVPAGVYKITRTESDNKKWTAGNKRQEAHQADAIVTKHLAINGYCYGVEDAANYMPDFIRYGYGEATLGNTYSLFFNPCYGSFGDSFRSIRDSLGIANGSQVARRLASALATTATKNQQVMITVHESGHAVLKAALKHIIGAGQKLDQFTVFYANPNENLERVDRLRKNAGMKLSGKPPLLNTLSASQYLTSGNFVSGPVVAARADKKNAPAHFFNAAATAVGYTGLASIGSGVVAAGWALGAAPMLLGQNRSLNKKVITSAGASVQEGAKAYAKLIWDPVHKMMVKP